MDCEMPDFYICKEPVARKAHKCCECSAPILEGEKYLIVRGSWDHEVSVFKQHLSCAAACMMIRDHFNDWECIGFGQLDDWLGENDSLKYSKHDPKVKEFRDLISKIRRRERAA